MWIGKTKFVEPQATELVESMRKQLATLYGVTVVGDTVTLRWYEKKDGPLVSISMKIYDVDNGEYEEFEDK